MATAQTEYRKIRVGDVVETARQLQSGAGDIIGKGIRVRVYKKHRGLALETTNDKPCPTCGIGRIVRVSHVDVSAVRRIA